MASFDIVTRELKQPIDVAEYLYRRLYQVGIRSVHGVPGRSFLLLLQPSLSISHFCPIYEQRLCKLILTDVNVR